MKVNLQKISRSFHKIGFKFKKHSPEIMVVSGVVGTVVAGVMACKATTKVSQITEDHNKQLEIIHSSAEAGEIETENGVVEYTNEDAQKDTSIVYAQTGIKFIKLYGPAVLLGAVSITSILAGHNILHKRNVALAAAYSVLDRSFKDYKDRVIERFGKDLEKEIRYNIKAKEFEKVVSEDGTETTEKEIVDVVEDPNELSEFFRIYDDGCKGWCKDPEANLIFLKRQQSYANDKLKSQGYLFLNDVYDMLGFPKTKAGQIVGWVYDENDNTRDNFVDFGFTNINKEKCRDFVNGYERNVILDFNVDGNILDMI